MIDDIVFDDIKFFILEKGNVVTGQIISFDLSGGAITSSESVTTGEVYF